MRRRRTLLLLIGLLFYFLCLLVVSWITFGALMSDDASSFADMLSVLLDPEAWPALCVAPAVLATTQFVFLLPVLQFRRGRQNIGKPLIASMVVLGFFAALVTVGAISGILELVGPWGSKEGVLGTQSKMDLGEHDWFAVVFWCSLLAGWCFWSVVLWRFVRKDVQPSRAVGRSLGVMLGGTAIESLAILPIDIMVRRRTDCYCNTGTFFALLFAATAVIWMSGPGLYIVLTSKRRRAWYELHCPDCGYAKGPSPGPKCPECGYEWAQSGRYRKQLTAHG